MKTTTPQQDNNCPPSVYGNKLMCEMENVVTTLKASKDIVAAFMFDDNFIVQTSLQTETLLGLNASALKGKEFINLIAGHVKQAWEIIQPSLNRYKQYTTTLDLTLIATNMQFIPVFCYLTRHADTYYTLIAINVHTNSLKKHQDLQNTIQSLKNQLRQEVIHTKEPINSFKPVAFKAQQYIRENLHRHITIEDLEAELATNRNFIRRAFKALFHSTVTEYITAERIVKSCELIGQQQTFKQIARATGYSLTSFNRVFKKIMRCTPTEYRDTPEAFIITLSLLTQKVRIG